LSPAIISTVLALLRGGGPSNSPPAPSNILTRLCLKKMQYLRYFKKSLEIS
jgi:hypothetical protein